MRCIDERPWWLMTDAERVAALLEYATLQPDTICSIYAGWARAVGDRLAALERVARAAMAQKEARVAKALALSEPTILRDPVTAAVRFAAILAADQRIAIADVEFADAVTAVEAQL